MSYPAGTVREVGETSAGRSGRSRGRGSGEVRGVRRMEREKMLDVTLAQIERQFGKGAVMRLGEHPAAAASLGVPVNRVRYVAVLTSGRTVFAISLATGRRAVLFHAPASVAAQVNDAGVVYRYNVRGAGFLGFIPFAAVERGLS